MSLGSKTRTKATQLFRLLIAKANYALDKYSDVIWLLGDGRSGTTWVSDLINHDKKYRELFEPFHPRLVRGMDFLQPHQYARPNESNDKLLKVASDVFRGKFMYPRVDSNNRGYLYQGLLVKDIFANLFCCWATQQLPKIKPILLIRNPFAVALSKRQTQHWDWATNPLALLNQASLYEDYLEPYEDLIRKTSAREDYVLNQILTWSIIHSIPLRQFRRGAIHVCFYEDVCTDPSGEISKMLRFVAKHDYPVNLPTNLIIRPSRVTQSPSERSFRNVQVASWKNEFPSSFIDDGLRLLEHFGLAELYDERSMPNREVLNRLHNRP